jgi:hypothetical protein
MTFLARLTGVSLALVCLFAVFLLLGSSPDRAQSAVTLTAPTSPTRPLRRPTSSITAARAMTLPGWTRTVTGSPASHCRAHVPASAIPAAVRSLDRLTAGGRTTTSASPFPSATTRTSSGTSSTPGASGIRRGFSSGATGRTSAAIDSSKESQPSLAMTAMRRLRLSCGGRSRPMFAMCPRARIGRPALLWERRSLATATVFTFATGSRTRLRRNAR